MCDRVVPVSEIEQHLDKYLDTQQRRYEAIRAKAEETLKAIALVRKLRDESGQEILFPELEAPGMATGIAAKTVVRAPRAYGGGEAVPINGQAEKFNLTQAVREVVQQLPHCRFQQPDITRKVKEKYPNAKVRPAAVTTALARMAERGEGIELVVRGHGSEPNTYETTFIYLDETINEIPAQESNMSP